MSSDFSEQTATEAVVQSFAAMPDARLREVNSTTAASQAQDRHRR